MATPKNQSVLKAFAVLRSFRNRDEWLTSSEVSRRAKLPEASGYRLLQTLEQIGVVMRVTPRVNPDGKILMRVEPQVSSVAPVPVNLGNGITQPAFNIETVQTTVLAADGETVVLGGLITKQENRTENGVPFFKDIPGVGALFRYRTRSVGHVLEEAALAQELFPQMKELFFDDDTFTDDRQRAQEIAKGLGKLGLTWSCNAKANVPRETLQVMRDNGLRLLLVGYETGDQQILINIKKGLRVERAKQFASDCRDLGITIHGTFILGLPGETKETIQATIKFAREVNPHTIQVSVAAPYPGTELYRQAKENGWLPPDDAGATLVSQSGTQLAALDYPHLGHTEILDSVDDFYKRFYFRAPKIAEMAAEMLRHPSTATRRLREGTEFLQFLGTRSRTA